MNVEFRKVGNHVLGGHYHTLWVDDEYRGYLCFTTDIKDRWRGSLTLVTDDADKPHYLYTGNWDEVREWAIKMLKGSEETDSTDHQSTERSDSNG